MAFQHLAVGLVLPSSLSAFSVSDFAVRAHPLQPPTSQPPLRAHPLQPPTSQPPFASKKALLTRLFSGESSDETPPTTAAEMESKKDQTFKTWSFDDPCESMEWTSLLDVDMTITPGAEALEAIKADADLVVVGVLAPSKKDEDEEEDDEEEKDEPVAELAGLAKELEGALAGDGVFLDFIAENNKAFKNGAKAGSTTPVARIVGPDGKAKRIMFVGLGSPPKETDKKKKAPFDGVGKAVGKALATACMAQKKVTTCAIVLPQALAAESAQLQDLSTAFYRELYADNRYKSKAKKKKFAEDLKTVQLVADGGEPSETAAASLTAGKQLATGILLSKDIVNAPHNVLNSLSLADTARRIAAESEGGCITCEILDKEACEQRGMGAFLGVGRGSETDPQFIHLTYKPSSGEIKKKVGIVGKGLLFDTGGYNIKTAMMVLMKFDCGGAAAVLGAARAIGAMQPEGVEAHFIVAACENMINAKAMVPSDILTASNGKTIEVLNTDAEGRLTLADALVFADKEVEADQIIELSTLTGACMISLGKQYAGLWTANDDLAKELEECSKVTGDKTWRMPLAAEYKEEIENSLVADLKNIGGKYGGAITAALFLQHFVRKKTPFAHIDIAGPVWNDKTGATGYGAQLVVEWIRRQGL